MRLIWELNNAEDEKHPSRSQIIDWNMAAFVGTNFSTKLEDKFYLRELDRIRKKYPELQISVKATVNESPHDKRHFATIEKVVSSHQSTSL